MIAFIGDFTTSVPNNKQLVAAQELIEQGVNMKYLPADYRLYNERTFIQGYDGASDKFCDIIAKWPHYSDKV